MSDNFFSRFETIEFERFSRRTKIQNTKYDYAVNAKRKRIKKQTKNKQCTKWFENILCEIGLLCVYDCQLNDMKTWFRFISFWALSFAL